MFDDIHGTCQASPWRFLFDYIWMLLRCLLKSYYLGFTVQCGPNLAPIFGGGSIATSSRNSLFLLKVWPGSTWKGYFLLTSDVFCCLGRSMWGRTVSRIEAISVISFPRVKQKNSMSDWRFGLKLYPSSHGLSQMLHGAGRFTYKTGSFLGWM